MQQNPAISLKQFCERYNLPYNGVFYAVRYHAIPHFRDPQTTQIFIRESEAQAAADFIQKCHSETRRAYQCRSVA